MKRAIKISLISMVAVFVALVLYLNYQTHFSKKAQEGNNNISNIKSVKRGMIKDEVLLIMGEPDTILPPHAHYPYTQFNYATNDESFPNVTVAFDSTMTVQKTYYPIGD